MDPELLDKLLAQRADLADRKAEADQYVRNLADNLRRLDQAIEAMRSALETSLSFRYAEPQGPSKAKRAANQLTPREIGEHARRLLIEAGRPLKRGPLLRMFDAEGIPLKGGDRAKVLGTILWRLHDDAGQALFVNTSRGYWPAGTEIPEL